MPKEFCPTCEEALPVGKTLQSLNDKLAQRDRDTEETTRRTVTKALEAQMKADYDAQLKSQRAEDAKTKEEEIEEARKAERVAMKDQVAESEREAQAAKLSKAAAEEKVASIQKAGEAAIEKMRAESEKERVEDQKRWEKREEEAHVAGRNEAQGELVAANAALIAANKEKEQIEKDKGKLLEEAQNKFQQQVGDLQKARENDKATWASESARELEFVKAAAAREVATKNREVEQANQKLADAEKNGVALAEQARQEERSAMQGRVAESEKRAKSAERSEAVAAQKIATAQKAHDAAMAKAQAEFDRQRGVEQKRTDKLVADARKAGEYSVRSESKEKIADLEKTNRDLQRNAARAAAEAKAEGKKEGELKGAQRTLELQGKFDAVSRELELMKQSANHAGESGEVSVHGVLTQEYAKYGDQIDRIGRGRNGGADVRHIVMDGQKEAGRIIYEVKITRDWKPEFIAQARKYYTRYDTRHVVIVSRVFPKKIKQQGVCVVDGFLVVQPQYVLTLVGMIRRSILEIAKLGLANKDTNIKAQALFEYIVSDEFQMRFLALAGATDNLNGLQKAERRAHDIHWDAEAKLIKEIDQCYREIDAKLQSTIKEDKKAPVRAVNCDATKKKAPGKVVNGDATRWAAAD